MAVKASKWKVPKRELPKEMYAEVCVTDYGVVRLRPTTAKMFNDLRRKDGRQPHRGTKKARAWADLERGINTAHMLWFAADEDLKEI